MRPLNLIPPEDRRGDSAPLRAGAASYAIVGVLAFALIAVVAVVLTSNKITDNESELASLQARQVAAQQAAQGLAPYDEFAALTTSRSVTVTQLARSRFDWERVLRELALVIPDDVTLTSVAATATPNTGDAGVGADGSITGPTLEITGCAEGQEGTASLLAALRDIDGVTRVGMQSSALSEAQSGNGVTSTGPTTGCDAKGAASFQITVAFDAVPAPAAPSTDGSTAAPVADTAAAPPVTDTSAAPTDDGGVAQTEGEQQAATASADEQTRRAEAATDGGTR